MSLYSKHACVNSRADSQCRPWRIGVQLRSAGRSVWERKSSEKTSVQLEQRIFVKMLKERLTLWRYTVVGALAKKLVGHQVRERPFEVVALAGLPASGYHPTTLAFSERCSQSLDGRLTYGF